jgi:hypothetical protein
MFGARQGMGMRRSFVVLSGTSIAARRERAPSATEALRLVLDHMRLRRPGVKIEDERGNPISFFELKEMAEQEKASCKCG